MAWHTIWFFWSFGFNLVLLRVSDEIVGFPCYFWFLLVNAIFDLTWLHLALCCLVYFWFVPDWTTHFVLSCSRLGIVRRSFSFLYRVLLRGGWTNLFLIDILLFLCSSPQIRTEQCNSFLLDFHFL